jgi:Ca-activated chloride channel family protein
MYRVFCIATACFAWALTVSAASPRSLVRQGNAEYARGNFDEALSKYEQATVELPESPHVAFNQAAAYYSRGQYDRARQAYEKAALKARDTGLESRSQFNMGNVAFRESERHRDSDLQKSLQLCEQSIRHYRQALDLDPGFSEAAENIEVARLVIKTILDEIKKQQDQQEDQQQGQQQQDQQQQQEQQPQGQQEQQQEQDQQQQGDEQQDQQQQDEQQDGDQQEQQAQQDQQQQPAGDEDEEQPEAMARLPDEARDILDEEEANRERRKVRRAGYRPVERDW